MSRSIFSAPACAGFLVGMGLGGAASAQAVTSFSGITSWVGSGSNSAAVVIDFNNGGGTPDTSLVWGYHWTGSATGEQMLDAIVNADSQLYLYILQSDEFGDAPVGFGFDPAADGNLQTTPSLAFTNRTASTANSGDILDSRTAVAAGNLWEEGWNSGFWGYWVSTNGDLQTDGFSDWSFAENGMSTEPVNDGDWDAFVFEPGFASDSPADPADGQLLVPEPGTWSLLLMGSLCLLRRKNRRDRVDSR